VLEVAHKRRKSSMAPRRSMAVAGRRASDAEWLYEDLETILTQSNGTPFVLFRSVCLFSVGLVDFKQFFGSRDDKRMQALLRFDKSTDEVTYWFG
jgi:hypothetical protein